MGGSGIGLAQILLIAIPSTLIGVIVGILFVWKRGKELSDDPEFLERMKNPEYVKKLAGVEGQTTKTLAPGAIKSVIIFGLAVAAVVLVGWFPDFLPQFAEKADFVTGFISPQN